MSARRVPKHTAKHISDIRRNAIVLALANGEGRHSIARRIHTSEHTIQIIAEEDWQQVATHKSRIAAQYERIADQANHRILRKLDSKDDIPLNLLVPVSGMATDKFSLLRADPTIHVQHSHQHLHAHITEATMDQILAHLPDDDDDEKPINTISIAREKEPAALPAHSSANEQNVN